MIFPKRSFALALSAMAVAAPAHMATAHGLEIESAWTTAGPATPAEGRTAYVTIVNEAFHTEYLYGVSTPFAERVELHQSTGPGAMSKVDRVEIPLSDRLDMRRAGYHLMLIGLKRGLKAGDRIPITLTFGEGRIHKSVVRVVGQEGAPTDGGATRPAPKH